MLKAQVGYSPSHFFMLRIGGKYFFRNDFLIFFYICLSLEKISQRITLSSQKNLA
jgi:hypothetical protein